MGRVDDLCLMKSGRGSMGEGADFEKGFTLLELIISITLIATIVLVISGALRVGYRSVNSGERKMEALERFRASLTIVRAQIESSVPLGIDHEGVKEFYFEGKEGAMKMATNYSIWGRQRGHVIVEYIVEVSNSGAQRLTARESPVGTAVQRQTTLFQGLDRIYFEYYHREADDLEGVWMTEWDDNTKIPHKIRLWLVQGRREISIIVPMRAQPA
jgi:general secretion pathway protein J